CGGKLACAGHNRSAHVAVRIGIESKSELAVSQERAESAGAMAQHDDDRFHAARAQVVDAGFDDGLFAEGKQRLERAHPFGLAGGEKYCSDVQLSTCS